MGGNEKSKKEINIKNVYFTISCAPSSAGLWLSSLVGERAALPAGAGAVPDIYALKPDLNLSTTETRPPRLAQLLQHKMQSEELEEPTTEGAEKERPGHEGTSKNPRDGDPMDSYLGLTDLGCTADINCLVQTLYHLGPVRRAIYQMPTESALPGRSIPLALQRLFYGLQSGGSAAICTKELIASFGWGER